MVKTTLPKKLHATRVTNPKKLHATRVASPKKVDFDKFYKGSYYTIVGVGGNLKEWKEGYQKMFDEKNIGTIKGWKTFKGKDLNDYYNLTGDNRYPQNLTFLAFPLTGLDISKLAIFKIKMRDCWFDDAIDNNLTRE